MLDVPVAEAELDRVLASKTFASSPSSRRLLKYLVEHSSGDAASLKEYSVGIDVFGKPPSYDPQRDSTVRIQIGRLRQKLAEYYQEEGRDADALIEIPKGGFRVTVVPNALAAPPSTSGLENKVATWRRLAIGFASALVVVAGLLARSYSGATSVGPWNDALQQLWGPFLESHQPLLVAFGTPLFVELQGTMLFRDRGADTWDKASASPRLGAVAAALGHPPMKPSYYYAATGEVGAVFALSKSLAPRKENITLVRDVQLSWQQLAENNVLFLGPPRFFRDKLMDMPSNLEILAEPDSFRVLHPASGEPATFPKEGVQGEGETFALVSHSPGPGGKGDVLSFMSNDTFGRTAAVEAFLDPSFATSLVSKYAKGGRLARYHQVLLKVRLKGGVSTEITPVVYRELRSHGQ